jgi:hypothetical protein
LASGRTRRPITRPGWRKGIRGRLKPVCSQGHGGSTPLPGTGFSGSASLRLRIALEPDVVVTLRETKSVFRSSVLQSSARDPLPSARSARADRGWVAGLPGVEPLEAQPDQPRAGLVEAQKTGPLGASTRSANVNPWALRQAQRASKVPRRPSTPELGTQATPDRAPRSGRPRERNMLFRFASEGGRHRGQARSACVAKRSRNYRGAPIRRTRTMLVWPATPGGDPATMTTRSPSSIIPVPIRALSTWRIMSSV